MKTGGRWWGAVRAGTAALGGGAAVVLAAALFDAGALAREQHYWSAGMYRLIVDAVWTSFDRVIVPVAAGALAAVGLGALISARWNRGQGRRTAWRGLERAGWVALAVVAGLRLVSAGAAWRAASGPNVLLISIDTLRADRLGAYGYTRPTSPEIDRRLAAEGVTFERCYSQSPKTTPSHMTMLTSLYPCVHGVPLWTGPEPGAVLSPVVNTLAEVLKNAGYATGAFTGRGHVHRSRGFGQGFDVYVHNYQFKHRHRYDQLRQLDRALEWMDEHRRGKFFMFFHTYAVHDPYVPPEDTASLFDDGSYQGPLRTVLHDLRGDVGEWDDAHRDFWASVRPDDEQSVRFVSALYDATIRHMDGIVIGPLLDRLESLGLRDDTLVVLTSDHGEAFGAHGRFLHGDLYMDTLRVPLILRFPGRLPAGLRIPGRVQVIDIMPTILDLLDLQGPQVMQGRSLVPAIDGDLPDALTAMEFSTPADNRVFESIRQGDLSYIVDRSTEELFDLGADPGEQRSVLGDRPEEAARMRDALASWRRECRRLRPELGPRGEGVAPSADTIEQLRALGYVN